MGLNILHKQEVARKDFKWYKVLGRVMISKNVVDQNQLNLEADQPPFQAKIGRQADQGQSDCKCSSSQCIHLGDYKSTIY